MLFRSKNEINEHWVILKDIDIDSFDFSWHHDPTDPPYIYVFGNQWYDCITEPTIEYHVEGATQRKYMPAPIALVIPNLDRYKLYNDNVDFDYSWHPHPHDPPYIYVFGNQWYDSSIDPVLEYHVHGAVEKKYVTDAEKIFEAAFGFMPEDDDLEKMRSFIGLLDIMREKVLPTPEGRKFCGDRKSTRLNSSHSQQSRMPSSA